MLLPREGDGGWPYSQAMLDRVAKDSGSVLITGESGTGKELLGYYLHSRSPRAKGPFVAVNCTGLDEERMRSELFGHAKGAYTGADREYEGKVMEATDGTLFLDEIGNMDVSNQARLLRFMQTNVTEPLNRPGKVANVRIIAATNKEVSPEKAETNLIHDLFFRFRFSDVRLPALRERQSDLIRLLLEPEFLGSEDHFTGITLSTLLMLAAQDWRGNMREFKRYCDNVRLFPEQRSSFAKMIVNGKTEPLPKHIFHEIQFARNPLAVAKALDYCLDKGISRFITNNPDWDIPGLKKTSSNLRPTAKEEEALQGRFNKGQKESPPNNGTKKTLALFWDLDPNEQPFIRSFHPVPNRHILPLSWLRNSVEPDGDFDFGSINRYMEQTMWLPHSWKKTNCSFADAIANVAHYCRMFRGDTPDYNYFKKMDLRRSGLIPSYASIVQVSSALPSWEMPSPPKQRDPAIVAKVEALDVSRCRKHSTEDVRSVMTLHFHGKKPKEIAKTLKGTLTAKQIGGIIRTYKD